MSDAVALCIGPWCIGCILALYDRTAPSMNSKPCSSGQSEGMLRAHGVSDARSRYIQYQSNTHSLARGAGSSPVGPVKL